MRRCLIALALLVGGCGSSLPEPLAGPHVEGETSVVVPYPPPPGRVEVVPPKPDKMENAVWVDGEWQWKGRRWDWHPGEWKAWGAGGYYAPAATVRFDDGSLVYYPGAWHAATAKK